MVSIPTTGFETAALKALGLEGERVTSIDIHMAVNDVATITVKGFLLNDEKIREFERVFNLATWTEAK